MKKTSENCLIFFLITIIAVNSCSPKPPVTIPSISTEINPISILPGNFDSNLIVSEQGLDEELETSTRYEVSLIIAEDYQHLNGHLNVIFTNNENQALNEIFFRLFPNSMGDYLRLLNTSVNGEVSQPLLSANNTAARFDLSAPLQPSASIGIEMDFEIKVPTDPSANYGLFAFFDDILSLYEFIPLIPVYDETGWHGDLSAEYGDQVFSDVSFFTVNVDAPQALITVASGVRTALKVENGRKQETFMAGPVRDFYLAASPSYEVKSSQQGEVTINVYYPAQFADSGEFLLQVAKDAVEVFSQEISPYPYSELDLVAAPMQGAYGMEYSSIVALGSFLFDAAATERGQSARSLLESAAAHEVAHQWFFNVVHSDQVNEPWLDEGMTQYATALYFEKSQGKPAAENYRQSWWGRWQRVETEVIPIGLPVSAYSMTEYSAIIYGRAPLFIDALRTKMGDEIFFRFLKAYYQTYQWNIVETDDFQTLAEQTCGCDLEELFGQWVFEK